MSAEGFLAFLLGLTLLCAVIFKGTYRVISIIAAIAVVTALVYGTVRF